MKKKIQLLRKSKNPLQDIISYFEGTIRYNIYYSNTPLRFLMRKHIREQIDFRIFVMNPDCYNQGSCIKCGCMTTALQMAKKSCEGLEYPPLVNRTSWQEFKSQNNVIYTEDQYWFIENKTLVRATLDKEIGLDFTTIKEDICL